MSGTESTYIVRPQGEGWRDQSAPTGLAAAGSGDVRAGIVAGFCARGARPEQAAVWAAFCHRRAGARLAVAIGPLGFLAREIVPVLPAVLGEIGR